MEMVVVFKKDELKQFCPFCGAEARMMLSIGDVEEERFFVECQLCKVRTKCWPNRAAAADNWNSRVFEREL